MFQRLMKWLRTLGTVGNFIATVLQFLFAAFPAITFSVVVTTILAVYTNALVWVSQPSVRAVAGIFIFLLWTYIGIAILRDRQNPRLVRIAHDYSYSLICEGPWQALMVRTAANHPHPNMDAVQIILPLRNVGAGPLRLRIEEFRIVLNRRTSDDSPVLTLTLPRMGPKGVRSAPIERDPDLTQLDGTATCRFVYGPPEGDPVRRYTVRADLAVNINGPIGLVIDNMVEETDEPIAGAPIEGART
jgi:hypothetical protein